MNADEARSLMKGSMKHKGFFFKIFLAWKCGIINKQIENAAEHGKNYVTIKASDPNLLFPIIAKLYEEKGFLISYDILKLYIIWGYDQLTPYEQEHLAYNFYFTKQGEDSNESDNAPSRNRKNKRTNGTRHKE